jgi:hypothetical protein
LKQPEKKVFVFIEDITEQKRFETALTEHAIPVATRPLRIL